MLGAYVLCVVHDDVEQVRNACKDIRSHVLEVESSRRHLLRHEQASYKLWQNMSCFEPHPCLRTTYPNENGWPWNTPARRRKVETPYSLTSVLWWLGRFSIQLCQTLELDIIVWSIHCCTFKRAVVWPTDLCNSQEIVIWCISLLLFFRSLQQRLLCWPHSHIPVLSLEIQEVQFFFHVLKFSKPKSDLDYSAKPYPV